MLNMSIKEPNVAAKWCCIWMHGLGADGNDMAMLVEQLQLEDLPIRHIFLDAPSIPVTINNSMSMPAWYDIVGVELSSREDEAGIKASANEIETVVSDQIAQGICAENIFLSGFSQGGAMALYLGLTSPNSFAGIAALSAYCPLVRSPFDLGEHKSGCPIFMAAGTFDPIVRIEWSKASKALLENLGVTDIAWHEYPMEHEVCLEEMAQLSRWFRQHCS